MGLTNYLLTISPYPLYWGIDNRLSFDLFSKYVENLGFILQKIVKFSE